MKNIILPLALSSILFANSSNVAERGEYFYQYNDQNTTSSNSKDSKKTSSKKTSSNKKVTNNKLLEELLEVAKEQRDIQKDIYELLKEEIHPTPQEVVVNGVKCIANSSAECFVMPLTKQAQKIPVLKTLLTNPNRETAKEWLRWFSKYMNTGPLKVGRSFEYAMNTYGEEAYPMNITRPSTNSNTGKLISLKKEHRQTLLNERYKKGTLGLYIFLGDTSLDYFSITEISKIAKDISPKKSINLVFKSATELNNFRAATQATLELRTYYKGIQMSVNKEAFELNNIYMTPSYMSVSNYNNKSEKQTVAIGRVSKNTLNHKIYEWLEQKEIIKKGGLSDYKLWNAQDVKNKSKAK